MHRRTLASPGCDTMIYYSKVTERHEHFGVQEF